MSELMKRIARRVEDQHERPETAPEVSWADGVEHTGAE